MDPSYQMEGEGGERFDTEIPRFSLGRPGRVVVVN